MKIFFANSAYTDLEGIKAYYQDEGVPHIGTEFVSSIIEHVQTLADNPEIGRVVPEFGRVVPEFGEQRIRELIQSPFRVVYLREHDSIHVVRVWRSERLLKLPKDQT